jgi:hypothetical protein
MSIGVVIIVMVIVTLNVIVLISPFSIIYRVLYLSSDLTDRCSFGLHNSAV